MLALPQATTNPLASAVYVVPATRLYVISTLATNNSSEVRLHISFNNAQRFDYLR